MSEIFNTLVVSEEVKNIVDKEFRKNNKKYKFNKIMKYIIRLICLPFWFMIGLIHSIVVLFYRNWLFLKYGGECITYLPEDKVTIKEIYDQIKFNSVIHFDHRNK